MNSTEQSVCVHRRGSGGHIEITAQLNYHFKAGYANISAIL